MNKIALLILASTSIILTTGCGDKTSDKINEFNGIVEQYDTTYKRNSLDIENIKLTFYSSNTEELEDKLTLSVSQKGRSKGDVLLWVYEYDKNNQLNLTGENMKKEEFIKFLENMNLILENPKKSLTFDFGSELNNSNVSAYGNDEIQVYISNKYSDKSNIYTLSKVDIENMKKAYDYYKSNLEQEFLK